MNRRLAIIFVVLCILSGCGRNGLSQGESKVAGGRLIFDETAPFLLSKSDAREAYELIRSGSRLPDNRAYAFRVSGEIQYDDGSVDEFSVTTKDVIYSNGSFYQVDEAKLDHFVQSHAPTAHATAAGRTTDR